jgi:hypothetical protein
MSNVELPVWYGTTPRQRAASVWDHLKVLTIEPGECTAPPMPKRTSRLTIMQPTPKPRRKRKPSIRTMIKQAEQAEKVVASITTPDGFTITFDPKDDKAIQTADDELAQWRKRKRNASSG